MMPTITVVPSEGRTMRTTHALRDVDATFRAANYLSVAQLYLHDNVLLRQPLEPRHIKPRLLGHWGTVPGINLVYAHLSRLVRDRHADVLYVVGPGHGAPGVLANLWLEGTLAEHGTGYTRDLAGMTRLARDFSWPGGLPSHLTAGTPGMLNEGGELGYSLGHAFGAVLDAPDALAVCLVGDGEAETGALAAAWQSVALIDPVHDGAVLPILHLNGYKLSGPSILARRSIGDLEGYFCGMGYEACEVTGDQPAVVHAQMAGALDWALDRIRVIQADARSGRRRTAVWPVIILRTPKGWTCPAMLDGLPLEGTVRTHQIPIDEPAQNPAHLAALEEWLRSYRPESLFADDGTPRGEVLATFPQHDWMLGRNRRANGGSQLSPLYLPDRAAHAVNVPTPGAIMAEATRVLGGYLRDVFVNNAERRNFRLFSPDETASNRLEAVFDATTRAFALPLEPGDAAFAPGGRVMEILSEHCCEGWLEGYLLTGRHGMFACYEAFLNIVDSMMLQHAKWLKTAAEVAWRQPIASLNYLVTSHVWEQDHNGYSHQGPGFITQLLTRKPSIARVYLPPDANSLISVAEHCLASRGHINLIVASKKPMPQWLTPAQAATHCAAGASVWEWAGNGGDAPEVVLAAAGDVPTREVMAAVTLLRHVAPDLRVRVVNVVDLFALEAPQDHPHGLPTDHFVGLFGEQTEVIVAFHGYPHVIHELLHHRPNPTRFHVRGYVEEGTTTTPFDMTVRNGMSRFHLAIEALRRVGRGNDADSLERRLAAHATYIREHGEDLPDVRDWRWTPEVITLGA